MAAGADKKPEPKQLPLFPGSDEQAESSRTVDQFEKGAINRERMLKRLMALYQRVVGGPQRELAEIDVEAARELGGLVRQRNDAFMNEIGAPRLTERKARSPNDFKSKSDAILGRELVIFRLLAATDAEVPAKSLFQAVQAEEPSIKEATLTAHLDRLIKDGLIMRERKGYYRSSQEGKEYRRALDDEIEARDLK